MIKEEIIKIDSFNTEQLKQLHEILENNQIIKIENELTDFGIIVVKYEDKKILLNEDFYLKIKLIRNKFYRELSNIVDHVLKFRLSIDIEKPVLGLTDYGTSIYEILLKDYVDLNKYKEKLKIALINYIGLYNFDNIFELTKEEMLKLEKYKYNPNARIKYIYEAYGMYCYRNEETISILKEIIDDKILSQIKECNSYILICPELIREYCLEHFEEFKEYSILDISQLFSIIYNKVLLHEIGHAVFDYLNDYYNEKRANYFASISFDGTFDDIIEKFTEHQDERYKKPILITKEDSKIIKKDIYHI